MSGCQLLLQELLKSFWWSQFLSLVGTLTNYQWHIYTSIGIPWQPRCWETYLSNNLYKKQKFTIWLFELNAGKSSFVWTTKDWDFCLIQQSSQCKNVPLHITVKFSLSWKVCCFLRRSEQTRFLGIMNSPWRRVSPTLQKHCISNVHFLKVYIFHKTTCNVFVMPGYYNKYQIPWLATKYFFNISEG